MIHRRTFVKVLTATAVASLIGCGSGEEKQDPVIVIGAGMAGLAAATALMEAGRDVIVLEARDRVGGRIHTSRSDAFDGLPIDLGASWIHGINRNPISALADKYGAETVSTSYLSAVTFDANGALITGARSEELDAIETAVRNAVTRGQNGNVDQPVRALVEAELGYSTLPAETQQLVDFAIGSNIEHEYSGSADKMSLFWHDNDEWTSGKDVVFPDGYDSVVKPLAEPIMVVTNQVVEQVSSNRRGVVVTTQDATYAGSQVLVTVPLGVLKSGKIAFAPPLPQAKQTAIEKLGMGVLNKCCLRFDEVFWPTDVDWIGYVAPEKGEWIDWVSLVQALDEPILIGFNAADFGRTLESLSDAETVASAMSTLRTIFGDNIPEPTASVVTRWASDPFSLGSYSFNALGSTPGMRDDLASPVDDRIFFAGEATSGDYFATVHGAYHSGIRAAEEINAL